MESLFNSYQQTVIVHDILFEYGGSERALETLLSIYPDAQLITLYMNPYNKIIQTKFKKYSPRTLGLELFGRLMTTRFMFQIMKLIGPLYFYFLNLSGYTLIISSSHAFNAKMVRKPDHAIHVCFLYTPPRHIYAELNSSLWMKRVLTARLFSPVVGALQRLDRNAATHPDIFIVPSKVVQRRVRRYYGRSSTVVYPPVHIHPPPKNSHEKNTYYLFVSRLVRQKGIELAVKTCTKYAIPLRVAGEGYLRKKVQKLAGKTVQFLGYVSDQKLSKLFAGTKALLFCAQNEDFGIVPIEVMAHGVPVVAYDDGATRETIVEGKTGVFFRSYTPEGLYEAIKKIEALSIHPSACYKQAQRFGEERYIRSVKKLMRQYLRML